MTASRRFDLPVIIAGVITGIIALLAAISMLGAPEISDLAKLIFIVVIVGLAAGAYFRPKMVLPLLLITSIVGLVLASWTLIFNFVDGALNFIFYTETRVDPNQIVQCYDDAGCAVIYPLVFSLILVFVILTGFAYTTLLERKLIAWFQQRSGPNRVGPGGFLQPLADAIKLIFKEDIIPEKADKFVYYMAPMLKAIPVLIVVAVIPLGPDILIPWFAPSLGDVWFQVPLAVADINVGVLWVLAVTSLATYGVVLAGWSSNNKYSSLGALRASAQMISYELSLGLCLAVPVMIVGSMQMGDIIDAQRNIWNWFVFQNPLAAGILLITLFAEVARAPFDLPEAEQELTAGYMTEYSGMKFALFMMAEYIGMIAVSMVAVSMFFGGYHLIPVDDFPILGPLFMIIKVVAVLAAFIWVRATLPRVRYDRLMQLGWKVLLPLSLLAVAWTAISVVLGDAAGNSVVYGIVSGIFFIMVVAGGYYFLRGEGDEDVSADTDILDDPMVTGEQRGAGWVAVNLLGTLIAAPMTIGEGIYEFIQQRQLSSQSQAALPAGDESAGD